MIFRELTCSPKNRLFQQIRSKKPKEYISEAGPHSALKDERVRKPREKTP